MTDLTEECFQRGALRFSGDDHWIQHGGDVGTRSKPFPAMRTTNGTFPAGSQWTRNPIPACKGPGGGSLAGSKDQCTGYQFPPPVGPDRYPNELGGFGNNGLGGGVFYWHVVDTVEVPA